jgi:outer membrane protein OmpA-like peptidoglycan-associated protein
MPTVYQVATLLAALALPLTAHADASASDPIELGTMYADAMTTSSSDEVVLFKVVEFAPSSARVYSREREVLMALAKTWSSDGHRALITVHGYSALDLGLAEKRAARIRGYLIKYGVAADRIATVAHTHEVDGRRVDLAVTSCRKAPQRCQQHASR